MEYQLSIPYWWNACLPMQEKQGRRTPNANREPFWVVAFRVLFVLLYKENVFLSQANFEFYGRCELYCFLKS